MADDTGRLAALGRRLAKRPGLALAASCVPGLRAAVKAAAAAEYTEMVRAERARRGLPPLP